MPQRIDINIHPRKPEAGDDKKTAAFPSRRRWRPGRRRSTDSRKFLNVYDMGQFANGIDSNLHEWLRTATTPYTVVDVGNGPSLTATLNSNTLSTRIASWNTDFLSIDNDDWPDTFKNITADIADYEIAVTGFDQYTSGKGLWSSADITSIAVLGTPGSIDLRDQWFFSFPVGGVGTRTVKYTSTPSYGASSVSFTFDKDCDLFLVPVALWGFGFSQYDSGGGSRPFYNYELWFAQRPLSRQQALGNANWDNVWTNKSNHAGIDAGGRSFLRSYFIEDAEAKLWRVRGDHAGGSQTIDADNPVFFPSSDFPESGEGLGTPTIQMEGVGLLTGSLAGAIRKHLGGGLYEWYFIWASTLWQVPDSAQLQSFEI